MTQVIIGDIIPYTQATAIASQTVFGTNWTANAASDVVVYQTPSGSSPNDVTQILPYPAGYSVAFIGALQQVQVTLVTGASAGDIITVTRQTPADRENLYSNTNFVPSMLNNDFGILTLVDQQAQLVNQLIGPRYNYSAVITDVVDTILPILGANQFWVMNGTNTAIVAATLSGSTGSGTVNVGTINQLGYYAATGTAISGLATGNNGILVTSNTGVPSIATTFGQGLAVASSVLSVGGANNIPFNNGIGIIDGNGNNLLSFTTIASSVNYVNLINNTTGSSPVINAVGSDSNIILKLQGKGTGGVAIQGTSTNDNVTTTFVGEYVESVIAAASAVTFTNNTNLDLTSISLTAGDWDVWGQINYVSVGGTAPNGLFAWLSATSATTPDLSIIGGIALTVAGGVLRGGNTIAAPMQRFSLSGTTTIYISGVSVATAGNATGCGRICARRRR